MNYGSQIRTARKQLGLTLKDFEERNLSFNLLSNIEVGKTKLTHQKAIMLYRRIVDYSWEREIFPELDLEEAIEDKQEYRRLKNAHEFCLGLRNLKEQGEALDDMLYKKGLAIANQSEVGALSFYILKHMADLLNPADYTRILEVNFSMLDYLRWTDMSHNMDKYQKCLYGITGLAYAKAYFKELIKYYSILMDIQEKYLEKVEPKVYYNLALFNTELGLLDSTHEYLKLYRLTPNLSVADQIDCDIIRAVTFNKEDKVEKAISYIEKALLKSTEYNLYLQQVICLTNLVYWLTKLEVLDSEMIQQHIERCERTVSDYSLGEQLMSDYYSNLALGYYAVGENEKMMRYFSRAFEKALNASKLIYHLQESFEIFKSLGDFTLTMNKVETINFTELSEKDKTILFKMLLDLSVNHRHYMTEELMLVFNKVLEVN